MVDAVDVAARDRQQVAGLAVGVVDRRVEHRDPSQPLVVLDRRGRRGRPSGRSRSRAGPCPRRTARRAGPSAGRSPSRSPPTTGTPRPRAGRASRRGSRRAGARRGPACRCTPRRGPARGPGSAASRGTAARCWTTPTAGRRRQLAVRRRSIATIGGRTGIGSPSASIDSIGPSSPSSSSATCIERRRRGRARRPSDGSVEERRRAVARGQRWPWGSSGWPHSGHGGRPAAISRSAWAMNARAAGARQPHPQEVGAVLVLVVERPRARLGRLLVLVDGEQLARLDEDELVLSCPSPSTACPTRNASLIGSSRTGSVCPRGWSASARRRRPAARARRAARQGAARARPPGPSRARPMTIRRPVAGLEEEGAVARFADGAGDEAVGGVEEEAASGHGGESVPDGRAAARADASADRDRDR